jgi:Flp pilus assembly protein TadD
MQRIGVLQMRMAAITLALLLQCVSSSQAIAAKDEICDVNADYALGLEDYAAAITLHRKVLRADNDDALPHYHLGFAYGMTGHSRDEINEYLEAARLGLNKWDLFLNLGLAYFGRNDWPKAINALRMAVLLGPDHPEAHFNLAIAYERENSLGKALQEITVSLRLAPLDPDEGNMEAIICAELGNPVCARDEWAHLVQVAPAYAPARVNLEILNGSHMPFVASTSDAFYSRDSRLRPKNSPKPRKLAAPSNNE